MPVAIRLSSSLPARLSSPINARHVLIIACAEAAVVCAAGKTGTIARRTSLFTLSVCRFSERSSAREIIDNYYIYQYNIAVAVALDN